MIKSIDELEADLELEREIDEIEESGRLPSSLIARGLNEEVLNEKFAQKIAANEFNEKTYKQCIADELLQELFICGNIRNILNIRIIMIIMIRMIVSL